MAGYRRAGLLVTNPADDVALETGDSLLVLTNQDKTLRFGKPAPAMVRRCFVKEWASRWIVKSEAAGWRIAG